VLELLLRNMQDYTDIFVITT